MKKTLALSLSVLLVIALFAGCTPAAQIQPSAEPAQATAEPTAAAATTPAQAETPAMKIKAAMIMDGPVDDGGWNSDCYSGLKMLESEYGAEIAYSESVVQADYVSAMLEYAANGYNVIIATGNQFTDAVKEIYAQYPDVWFIGINFDFSADNVMAYSVDDMQGGFIFGSMAALLTQNKSVGYIGGTEIQSILDGAEGMKKGVAYVDPTVQFSYALTGSWNDAAKGKELAISQITTSKVDVILGYASACNVGMIEACQEYGAKFIATPGANDTNPDTIAGNVIMSNGMLIKLAVGHILDGTAKDNLVYTGTVADGVIKLGNFGNGVSQEVKDRMAQIMADLASGKINAE